MSDSKPPGEASRCPGCDGYNKPGMIWNAGAWIRCPMCNAGKALTATELDAMKARMDAKQFDVYLNGEFKP